MPASMMLLPWCGRQTDPESSSHGGSTDHSSHLHILRRRCDATPSSLYEEGDDILRVKNKRPPSENVVPLTQVKKMIESVWETLLGSRDLIREDVHLHHLALRRLYCSPSLPTIRPNVMNSAATNGVGDRIATTILRERVTKVRQKLVDLRVYLLNHIRGVVQRSVA